MSIDADSVVAKVIEQVGRHGAAKGRNPIMDFPLGELRVERARLLLCLLGAATALALTTVLAFAPVVAGCAAALTFAIVFSFARVLIVNAVVGDDAGGGGAQRPIRGRCGCSDSLCGDQTGSGQQSRHRSGGHEFCSSFIHIFSFSLFFVLSTTRVDDTRRRQPFLNMELDPVWPSVRIPREGGWFPVARREFLLSAAGDVCADKRFARLAGCS